MTSRLIILVPDMHGYSVSDQGEVFGPKGNRLKPWRAGRGYLYVGLGRNRRTTVHSLVARVFIGPKPDGYQVAHNNGNKLDNRACNLRYVTAAENAADRIKHGTQARGETHGNAKLTEEAVRILREDPNRFTEFGVTWAAAKLVAEGKRWGHVA